MGQGPSELLITGLGVTSAIGQGKTAFSSALMQGKHAFGIMKRPGRQKGTTFLGAEIDELSTPDHLSKKQLRTASFSSHMALVTLDEAWQEAKLYDTAADRVGLIVGGSNIQQRELLQTYEAYRDRSHYLSPTYAFSFMDSDVCALCTEQFGIHGLACTVGGASASGQLAVIQASQAILSRQVDICIALGALTDISYMECQAFRALGAMGTDRYVDQPALASRPFDKKRDGFIYGENCGAVVIERRETAMKRGAKSYASIPGWAWVMDGNRNPNPSYEGEVHVIRGALEQAGLSPDDIDYVNPHGTGSLLGDETELHALADCGLTHAYINATKSITGHGLSAAGMVEMIATLLQMRESRLHPTRNLYEPMDESFHWVGNEAISTSIRHALNLSIGFGGINTAVCLKKDAYHL